jgi:hypothetical protein
MTQNDVLPDPHTPTAPSLFYDRVAVGGWPFDLHNPNGILNTSQPAYGQRACSVDHSVV